MSESEGLITFVAIVAAIVGMTLVASVYFAWFIFDLMQDPPKLGSIIQPIKLTIPFTSIEIFRYPKSEFVFTVPGARPDTEPDEETKEQEPPEVALTPKGFVEVKRKTKPTNQMWDDVINKAKEQNWTFKQAKRYLAEAYSQVYADAGDIERGIRSAAKTRGHDFAKESSVKNLSELS